MAELLEDPRIKRFLATKEVVVLATVQEDGSPLATPMWFLHVPGALAIPHLILAATISSDRGRFSRR